jgi:ubiquinone/menaquinone biosynthesis C-methylase UbiE
MKPEVLLQRAYYTNSASTYESMHVQGLGEHDLACAIMESLSAYHGCASVLDVGSGTGRVVARLRKNPAFTRVLGVEPVKALREVGHGNGIPADQLIDGDATELSFADDSFDLVCAFGVLHHVRQPRLVLSEMTRVAAKAIFLSDSNRFAGGAAYSRYMKLWLWKLGMWPIVDWIKTRGRGYSYSEGDGVAYSYSIFDDYKFLHLHFDNLMSFNLDGSGRSCLTEAPHIGLFGTKRK